jgi:hypothetical protein
MKNLKKERLFLLILLTVLLTGCFKEYSSPPGTTRIQGFLLEYGSEKLQFPLSAKNYRTSDHFSHLVRKFFREAPFFPG